MEMEAWVFYPFIVPCSNAQVSSLKKIGAMEHFQKNKNVKNNRHKSVIYTHSGGAAGRSFLDNVLQMEMGRDEMYTEGKYRLLFFFFSFLAQWGKRTPKISYVIIMINDQF